MMAAAREARVFVAGHRGMVGSAIVRRLTALGYTDILTASRSELNLLDQRAVSDFFRGNAIDQDQRHKQTSKQGELFHK